MNKPAKNLCFKCEERVVGCHSQCEKYKQFRRDMDEKKKKMAAITQTNVDCQFIELERERRVKKYHKKF